MEQQIQEEKRFKNSIIASGIVHIIVIAIFFFGMPSFFEKLPEDKDALTFEVLPLSAITNIKNQDKTKEKPKEKKEPEKAKKNELAQKPKEQPKPKPKEETKPVEKKKQEPKKEAIAAKPNAKKPKPPEPKVTQEQEDQIDSILKNLEKAPVEKKVETNEVTTDKIFNDRFSRGAEYNEESPLSITEKLLIKNQIQKHWHIPIEAVNVPEIKVVLQIRMERDGTISKVFFQGLICPQNSMEVCKLTAKNAMRAVIKARRIENLPTDRYDSWKELQLNFVPILVE